MLLMKDLFVFEDLPLLFDAEAFVWDPLIKLSSFLSEHHHKIQIPIPPHVFFKHQELISIGEGTTIDPTVLIEGPCMIGKNCTIRHGAFLRGPLIISDECSIGHGTEVKGSILMKNASIAHLCYVGDSIIGPHVNLGAGVKCSNLRLDRREILVGGIPTSLRKLGAILGEGVQVGCNCVLNPGTVIGKKSLIYPLLNVGGVISHAEKIRRSLAL